MREPHSEQPPCPADAPNVESGCSSDSHSPGKEQAPFTNAVLVGLLSELLAELKLTNRAIVQLATATALAVDLMASEDEEPEAPEQYLDQTPT